MKQSIAEQYHWLKVEVLQWLEDGYTAETDFLFIVTASDVGPFDLNRNTKQTLWERKIEFDGTQKYCAKTKSRRTAL